MKRINLFLLLLLILSLCSCSSNDVNDLKFYVFPRNSLNSAMSNSEIIDTAKTKGRLIFEGEDIDGYHWASHTVILNKDAITSLGTTSAKSGGSALFKVDDSYAFALILNNKLIYAGGFEFGTKNPDVPLQPYIKDETKYSFSIQFDSKYASFKDNRNNTNLYNFLEFQGLLTTKLN